MAAAIVDTRELMAEAKFYDGYSRYDEDLGRYETWDESVDRVMEMHREYYPERNNALQVYLDEATVAYKEQRVLGAQRALQFGGAQILKHQMKMYNCTSSYADRAEFFGEIFYILLCGAGAGFSVQKHHIAKLPKVAARTKQAKTHVVSDDIEGWAEAIDILMSSYFVGGGKHPDYEGRRVFFDLTMIRPKGSEISGGFKAPGPDGLRLALDRIEHLMQRLMLMSDDVLRSIDVYDIVMHIADAVLSGGVRRSATICLFSADDILMMKATTGNWGIENPQRARSNNSAVIVRSETTLKQFKEIMVNVRQFGEPGFVFVESTEHSTNPCFVGETNIAVADGRNSVTIKQLANDNKPFPVYSAHISPKGQWTTDVQEAIAFKTGTKSTINVELNNGDVFSCTPEHKLAIPGGGYIEAQDALGVTLEKFFTHKEKYRRINTYTNAYNNQHRMIWEFYNEKIETGYVIDHFVSGSEDFIDNLQILSKYDHDRKTGNEMTGENNPVHKIEDTDKWKNNLSNKSFLENNPNFNGLTNEDIIKNARLLLRNGDEINFDNLRSLDTRSPMSFSKNRFGGSIKNLIEICKNTKEYVSPKRVKYIKNNDIAADQSLSDDVYVISISKGSTEDVYDLKVENNSNFYILTSGDKNYENSKGILVHNCVEIGMFPQIGGVSGWQGCNLTEINGGKCDTEEDFYQACRAAAILGTLQAGYTDFKFLTDTTREIFERESLIGCSITGWMNNPNILFDKNILRKGARIVKEVNREIADIIGINPAARTTCVKPSGNASVLLQTASGIHAEHSARYIRNVQLTKDSEVTLAIMKANPYMVEDSVYSSTGSDVVVSFPIVPKKGSMFKDDLLGVSHLEKVKLVQKYWVEEGTNPELCADPGVRHNVSNTIIVDDWDAVEKYVFNNRNHFAGISFMSQYGDKDYNQAPNTEIITAKELLKKYGEGAIFASGLIVDGLSAFDNLWLACSTADDNGEDISVENTTNVLKRDWVRRFHNFAENYLKGDAKKAELCLKDVYLLHKWNKIQTNFVPIDWKEDLTEKRFIDIDTLGAIACAGGQCDIDF